MRLNEKEVTKLFETTEKDFDNFLAINSNRRANNFAVEFNTITRVLPHTADIRNAAEVMQTVFEIASHVNDLKVAGDLPHDYSERTWFALSNLGVATYMMNDFDDDEATKTFSVRKPYSRWLTAGLNDPDDLAVETDVFTVVYPLDSRYIFDEATFRGTGAGDEAAVEQLVANIVNSHLAHIRMEFRDGNLVAVPDSILAELWFWASTTMGRYPISRCQVCGLPVISRRNVDADHPMRKYCSDACKTKACEDRHSAQ